MGLFDQVLSSAISGAMKGGASQQGGANPLAQILGSLGPQHASQSQNILGSVMQMVQQNGGLVDVLGKFAQNGLKKEADSWVSTGPNMPISQNHIEKVFGAQALQGLAKQTGMNTNDAGSAIAKLLPELINQLTPKGSVPNNHADLFSQGMAILKGLQKS